MPKILPEIDLGALWSSFRNSWLSKPNRRQHRKLIRVQRTTAAAIETPLESLETAYSKIRGELKAELLDRLKAEAPAVFERIVIELLVKMGYGGSRADAAEAIGKSGDEGLDGIIKEDRLGLDIIYVQAKRWAATVGRPEIQKFAGALHGQHAN